MSLEVVAGLIVVDDRLLVCQRKAAGAFPLEWEFPGGKVEPKETKAAALARELSEELNIDVTGAHQIFAHHHPYSSGYTVNLTFFRVDRFTGAPENRVFNDMRWVQPNELGRFNFLDGDKLLIRRIRDGSLSLDMPQRSAKATSERNP